MISSKRILVGPSGIEPEAQKSFVIQFCFSIIANEPLCYLPKRWHRDSYYIQIHFDQ